MLKGVVRILPDSLGRIPCRTCGDPRPADEFRRTARHGIDRRCRACDARRSRKRNARPEVRERTRARDAARRADPDVRESYRLYSLEYNRTRVTNEQRLLRSAKDRARKLDLPFSISLADIQIPERCPLLDVPIVRGKGKPCAQSPSLDRIDPALGYVPGNVWVISYRANAIKQDATPAELALLTRRLLEKTEWAQPRTDIETILRGGLLRPSSH